MARSVANLARARGENLWARPFAEWLAVTSDVGGAGDVAALQYDRDYRLSHLGFPLESVAAIEDRAAILRAAFAFFR